MKTEEFLWCQKNFPWLVWREPEDAKNNFVELLTLVGRMFHQGATQYNAPLRRISLYSRNEGDHTYFIPSDRSLNIIVEDKTEKVIISYWIKYPEGFRELEDRREIFPSIKEADLQNIITRFLLENL